MGCPASAPARNWTERVTGTAAFDQGTASAAQPLATICSATSRGRPRPISTRAHHAERNHCERAMRSGAPGLQDGSRRGPARGLRRSPSRRSLPPIPRRCRSPPRRCAQPPFCVRGPTRQSAKRRRARRSPSEFLGTHCPVVTPPFRSRGCQKSRSPSSVRTASRYRLSTHPLRSGSVRINRWWRANAMPS